MEAAAAPKSGPSAWWYALGAGIIALSVFVGAAIAVTNLIAGVRIEAGSVLIASNYPRDLDSYRHLHKGTYSVVYESWPREVPAYENPKVTVWLSGTGTAHVSHEGLRNDSSFSSSDTSFSNQSEVALIVVTRPGDFRIHSTLSGDPASGNEDELKLYEKRLGDDGPFGRRLLAMFGGLGVALLGALVGGIVLLVVGLRRGQAHRANRPPPPPWPGMGMPFGYPAYPPPGFAPGYPPPPGCTPPPPGYAPSPPYPSPPPTWPSTPPSQPQQQPPRQPPAPPGSP